MSLRTVRNDKCRVSPPEPNTTARPELPLPLALIVWASWTHPSPFPAKHRAHGMARISYHCRLRIRNPLRSRTRYLVRNLITNRMRNCLRDLIMHRMRNIIRNPIRNIRPNPIRNLMQTPTHGTSPMLQCGVSLFAESPPTYLIVSIHVLLPASPMVHGMIIRA